jgi:hypothetical protein
MHAGNRKYGWALRVPDSELHRLSPEARNGLLWARDLANNRKQRREHALTGQTPARLTLKAMASHDWALPSEVTVALRQARIELFGDDLSDSAAYNRVRQHHKLGTRHCNEPGCTTQLPPYAHASLRYCPWHGSNHARTSRHRRNQNAHHEPQ